MKFELEKQKSQKGFHLYIVLLIVILEPEDWNHLVSGNKLTSFFVIPFALLYSSFLSFLIVLYTWFKNLRSKMKRVVV